MSNQYNALLQAIESYYGAGSDQWVEIAKYGMSGENAYSILSQTPGVNINLSKSGQVLGYTVDQTASLASQNAGAAINSNTQIATMTETAKMYYPAEMAVDAQTGLTTIESGSVASVGGASVASVLGTVAGAVGAVACGIQLGAKIDSILYNANPDFWDENGMSSLDPQTWDSLCETQAGKDVFNMLFGIDKNTGETQGYMDEYALAYIAQYMALQGAFDSSGEIKENPDNIPIPSGVSLPIPSFGDSVSYKRGRNYPIYILSGFAKALCFICQDGNTLYPVIICVSSQSFDLSQINTNTGISTVISTSIQITKNGKTYYYSSANLGTLLSGYEFDGVLVTRSVFTQNEIENLSYLLMYNTSSGGVDGITPQDGATLPSGITEDMTIAEVLQYLKTTYPDLWQDAIENDVIQQDGTIKKFTYVPVGIPDSIPKDQITGQLQPTGGVNTKQGDTTVSDTSDDDLIKTLLSLITAINPQDPSIPKETDPSAYPDTGEGSTPPIVVPVGSANALYSVYNPSQAQINSFGAWLWSNNFVDQLLKLFNDPMQAIIGLHKIFATPSTSGTGDIYVGYLDSGVQSKLVDNQYTSINCGTVNLYEYFGNVLDYTETDIYLYLPFIGIVPINVYDIMRSSISVTYKVDVLTGACLASVNVTRDAAGGQLYTYAGDCAVQYPLSSGSYMGIVASLAGLAGAVVGTIATGGAMLPVAIGAGASALGSAKTKVEHSGALSGNAGAMGVKKPYLIIRRPQTCIAQNFDIFDGVTNNEYTILSSLSGFNRVEYVNLENIGNATGEEMTEIEAILKSGVII